MGLDIILQAAVGGILLGGVYAIHKKGVGVWHAAEGEIARDLSAARHFINKIEGCGEGFFYI